MSNKAYVPALFITVAFICLLAFQGLCLAHLHRQGQSLAAIQREIESLQESVDLLQPAMAQITDAVNSTSRTYRDVKLTAYTVNSGATKIGKTPKPGWTAAVSSDLIHLLGRRIYVPEINKILRVTDTTHTDIEGPVVDVFVTHKELPAWKNKKVSIIVIE